MAQIWIIIDNLISIKGLSKIAFLYLNSRLVYANKYQLHFRVNISFILKNMLVNLKKDVVRQVGLQPKCEPFLSLNHQFYFGNNFKQDFSL
jgi:hypothetical protein